jgi:hypothetical protein
METDDGDGDDLLYGDLDNTGRDAQVALLLEKVDALTKKNEAVTSELTETKHQLQVLVTEKAVVERNMVVLFNTALREIERKDKQIAELLNNKSATVSAKRQNTG